MSDRRLTVVAEIGNNHEGNFDLAQRLIREAAACGADAVKLQTCRADLFISPADPERLARFRSYEFTQDQWSSLARFAHDCKVAFYSTPLDLESAALLEPLVDAFKVASGDLTFAPLLDYVAGTGKPVILSTGASEMREVNAAVERIRCAWRAQGVDARLAVLHCVSAYPAPPDQANLDAIRTLSSELDDVVVGYSDHVTGIEACVAAAAVGAEIIEKHFTVDKAQSSFRDHALSADPAEFRELVQRIRGVEAMLGSARKQVQPAEQGTASAIRRSISAARDLSKGHELNARDLIWLRPGTGIAPGNEARLIGRRLTRDVARGDILADTDVA
jgi:N,N'-diacetyllegionaminate synthase